MPRTGRSLLHTALAASALLAAACSAPLPANSSSSPNSSGWPNSPSQGRNEPPDFRAPSYSSGTSEPFRLEHATFDVSYVPAMWIQPDIDSDTPGAGSADLDPGSGVLARAGMGSKQQNIGLLYLGTKHDENDADINATTQSLYLDFLYRAPIASMNGAADFAVAAGLGVATLGFDHGPFDDETTGAAMLRGELEFPIFKPLTLSAGLAGFLWGHPGETVAYGTFITVGAKLIF